MIDLQLLDHYARQVAVLDERREAAMARALFRPRRLGVLVAVTGLATRGQDRWHELADELAAERAKVLVEAERDGLDRMIVLREVMLREAAAKPKHWGAVGRFLSQRRMSHLPSGATDIRGREGRRDEG